jgi:hypothetical protein
MTRQILFYVEGYAELEFVNEVIGPHLNDIGIIWHKPVLVANSVRKDRTTRGGLRKYAPIKRDLQRLLNQYSGSDFIFTTLLDYYGLPADFPSGEHFEAGQRTPLEKVRAIEAAWKEDIDDHRFLPNLLLHEFETLVLSRPESLLTAYPGMKQAVEELRRDIAGFKSPEEINDDPNNAPSKRIIRAFESHHRHYDKVTGGGLAILEIGLKAIREKCPKFHCWMEKLESFGAGR